MTNEVATKQIIRLATVKLKKFRTTCLWTGAKKQWDFNPKMISIIVISSRKIDMKPHK